MLIKTTPTEPSGLEEAVDKLLAQLKVTSPETKEYSQMVDQLTKLYKLKEMDNSTRRVSADTLANIIGSLLGILLIIGHERQHIITTKALGFVMRLK